MNIKDWSNQDRKDIGSYLQWNSFRSERHRLFYVATPKVACTTLKWWFANLEDCSQEVRAIENNPESDAELAVHHAHLVAPNLTGLSQSEISNVLDSDSYFKFAVVRNPYQRIFSAWQSKILLREPLQVGPYVDTDFYHYPIKTAADIANAFEIFLEHLAANEAPAYWDHHWTPQADLLRPDFINYTCLVKIEESEILTQKLGDWLGRYIPSPFQGRRSNESLIPYASELVTERSAVLIRTLYAHDFDVFGYDKQVPEVKGSFSVEQYDTAINAIKIIRARHKRLGERNELIVGLNDRLVQCEGQISNLVQAVAERDSQIVGLNDTRVEHEGQIASLSQALIERDSQIAGLNDTRVEYEGQIASLSQALIERDSQIFELNDTLAEHEGVIASLSQAVTERDSQIIGFNDMLAEHEGQIASLSDAVTERDSQIAGLNDTRVEYEGQIASLSQALIERGSQIFELNDTLAEHEGQIASLTLVVAERDNHISELNNVLVQNHAQLNFQSERIKALQQSYSWRLTKPLRIFSSLFKNSIKSIRVGVGRGIVRIPLIRQRAMRQIQQHPLFDREYYMEQNPDVVDARIVPAKHYYLSGWKEHRDPSAQFSTQGYLKAHPDVAEAGINPLLHYIRHGQNERRTIYSVSDTLSHQVDFSYKTSEDTDSKLKVSTYDGVIEESKTEKYEGELLCDENSIVAEIEVINKSGLFDADYYSAMYPEINLDRQIDLIEHYCKYGWREGRNPCDGFDTLDYLEANPDIKAGHINPFWHYIIAGAKEARKPLPYFDSKSEREIYFGDHSSDLRLVAYYVDPNWVEIDGARAKVKGADRPLVPHDDLDFNRTCTSATLQYEAQLARKNGISAWCFPVRLDNWPLSDIALNVLLDNKEVDLGFCLDVSIDSVGFDEISAGIIRHVFEDERYIRVKGQPILILRLSDISKIDVLKNFIYLIRRVVGPVYTILRGIELNQSIDTVCVNGLDAVLDFAVNPVPGETGLFSPVKLNGVSSVPYSVVVSQAIHRIKYVPKRGVTVYRALTTGKDSLSSEASPLRYTRFDLREYRRWFDALIKEAKELPDADGRLIFINSWNDWAQGAVLEPDRLGGYSKLNETSRALLGIPCGKKKLKVSVIVPNFNHGAYLRKRLNSIYQQTYKNIEVFLLDDCSTDESLDVLRDYASRYSNITTLLVNEQNSGGVFNQWAKGISLATGDLVWVAESDDYCDEDFIEKLVECFIDESVMLAYSKVEFVNADESIIPDKFDGHVYSLSCRDKWKKSYVSSAHNEVSEALGIINTIPNASGVIFRRPVDMCLLKDDAWLSLNVVGDWIFYLNIICGGKVSYCTETVNYFRRHQDSVVAKASDVEMFCRELSAVEKVINSLYNVPLSTTEKFIERSKELYYYLGGESDADFLRNMRCEGSLYEHACIPNILVSTMGFSPGGAEIIAIRMANEFKRQGYPVLLLNLGIYPRESGVRQMLRNDIPVVETNDLEQIKTIIYEHGINALNSHQWEVQKFPFRDPDIFKGLQAHVASLHGMIENIGAFGVTKEQLVVANKDVTTWVYTADKNLSMFKEYDLYQNDQSRFVKLPNGLPRPEIKAVSRKEMGIPEDAFVLCCVSRAVPEKGWAETIAAVSLARELSRKDIRLILVGNGSVYDEFCRVGVPDFVVIVGFSENSAGYYASADMGIMLTRFGSESFPLTIIDCLFSGRPYISTDVGEIRNMLTVENALAGGLIELNNWEIPVEEAAKLISNYATDIESYNFVKERVARAASKYNIDIVARKYLSIFERTIVTGQKNASMAH